MTTNILDSLLPDFEELQQEEARQNRPSFRDNPIRWRGKLSAIQPGTETFSDGREFPSIDFVFDNVKFLDVGNAVGLYVDGQSYTLQVQPAKAGVSKRLSAIGKSTLATGKKLDAFLGQEVDVVELSETYKAANGYDRQSYHWKFTAVPGTNGAKPAAEVPAELTEAALAFLAHSPQAYSSAGMALLRERTCNQNVTLNGKFGDRSWFEDMRQAGRIQPGSGPDGKFVDGDTIKVNP